MITNRDDDYLICRHYYDHINDVSSEYPNFITFTHNDNHYFAWVNGDKVILRSEAYPDEEKMIRGIKAILKNKDLPERYSVDSSHGAHFLVLWGGGDHQSHTGNFESHNEIGRSCPDTDKAKLHDMLLFMGKDFADKVVRLDGDGTAKAASVGAATAAAATTLTSHNSVTEETKPVAKVNSTASTTASASTAAKGVAKAAASSGGGFKWWWLLPLLLIPLFFMMRGCDKEGAADVSAENTTVPIVEESAVVVGDTVASSSNAVEATTPAAAAATPDCNLNWILFDFDKFNIRSDASAELKTMADILKGNPSYKGVLSAHTDARGSNEYNDALSLNRANAAKDALVGMGIEGARISTNASSEAAPIATNTDDDSGRKFNRRVELRVVDANGKEICKSIPPAVPANLKSN